MNQDSKVTLGWVSLDEEGKPLQPTLGRGWRAKKKPITVYQTKSRAMTYSPVDRAIEVFYEVQD